ncbi:MAG TPA: SMI1/KNR4 family protein [Enhygromyxa sp.]|nr:SMI1/KNR4 family protein [Enhygromyxa sp.]
MADAWIDTLLARIDAWTPGFSAKLEGASEEELVEFERALGRALPDELRTFSTRMGREHGGLIGYGPELRFDIASLIEHARDEAHAPPNVFCVAGAPDPDYMAIYVDQRQRVDAAPLVRLGVIDGTMVSYPEHSSLAAMLFGFAFITQCLPRYDYGVSLRSSGVRSPSFPNSSPRHSAADSPRGTWLPHFRWIAEQLGFIDLPGSGPWWACVEREDAAMMLFEAPGHAPDVRVAARERKGFSNLVELLSDNLDLNAHPGTLRQPP